MRCDIAYRLITSLTECNSGRSLKFPILVNITIELKIITAENIKNNKQQEQTNKQRNKQNTITITIPKKLSLYRPGQALGVPGG
jgi:hypothetical protein